MEEQSARQLVYGGGRNDDDDDDDAVEVKAEQPTKISKKAGLSPSLGTKLVDAIKIRVMEEA